MPTIVKQSTCTRKDICQKKTDIDMYLWKIENFSSFCTKNTEKTIDPWVDGPKSSNGFWDISFHCFTSSTHFEVHCSSGEITDKTEGPLPTSVEITIINRNSSKNIQATNQTIYTSQLLKKTSDFSLRLDINLFKVVKLNPSSWLTNDVLTISIKLVTVHESLPIKINHPLISGLLSYLENEKFSDIILEVDGKELKAHKMMLSLKSPVFSAMFDHESMNESRDNRVVIQDIDVDVVKQMLEYIYTGKTPSKIDNCVYDLIGAAHKYQMNDLQEICENNLLDKLAVDNAVKTLIISDFYHAEKLKRKVVKFIKQNVSIFDSDEFKDLELKNANLAITILRKLIPRK